MQYDASVLLTRKSCHLAYLGGPDIERYLLCFIGDRECHFLIAFYGTEIVLVSRCEIVVVDYFLFECITHTYACVWEILAAKHVVAQLEVCTTDSKHHSICEQNTGDIEGTVVTIVIHIGSKHRLRLTGRIVAIRLDNLIQVAVLRLVSPCLVVGECHMSGLKNSLRAVTGYCVHDKILSRMRLVHRIDKRGIGGVEVQLLSRVGIAIATIAQLVNLIAIEVEVVVHLLVALGDIRLPIRITRVGQEDITFPAAGQYMAILTAMVSIFEHIPFFLHTVTFGIIQRTESQVVEDSLHTVTMLHADILTDDGSLVHAVGNIGE